MKKPVPHDRSDDGMPEVSPLPEDILARVGELHALLNEEFKALHAEFEAAARAAQDAVEGVGQGDADDDDGLLLGDGQEPAPAPTARGPPAVDHSSK